MKKTLLFFILLCNLLYSQNIDNNFDLDNQDNTNLSTTTEDKLDINLPKQDIDATNNQINFETPFNSSSNKTITENQNFKGNNTTLNPQYADLEPSNQSLNLQQSKNIDLSNEKNYQNEVSYNQDSINSYNQQNQVDPKLNHNQNNYQQNQLNNQQNYEYDSYQNEQNSNLQNQNNSNLNYNQPNQVSNFDYNQGKQNQNSYNNHQNEQNQNINYSNQNSVHPSQQNYQNEQNVNFQHQNYQNQVHPNQNNYQYNQPNNQQNYGQNSYQQHQNYQNHNQGNQNQNSYNNYQNEQNQNINNSNQNSVHPSHQNYQNKQNVNLQHQNQQNYNQGNQNQNSYSNYQNNNSQNQHNINSYNQQNQVDPKLNYNQNNYQHNQQNNQQNYEYGSYQNGQNQNINSINQNNFNQPNYQTNRENFQETSKKSGFKITDIDLIAVAKFIVGAFLLGVIFIVFKNGKKILTVIFWPLKKMWNIGKKVTEFSSFIAKKIAIEYPKKAFNAVIIQPVKAVGDFSIKAFNATKDGFSNLGNSFKNLFKGEGKAVTKFNVDIVSMKSLGELNVYQIKNKMSVDHQADAFANFSKLSKIFSNKKMVVDFDFDLNFIYDLNDPNFQMQQVKDNEFNLKMPSCKYRYSVKNINIHSEESSKLKILPNLKFGLISKGFSYEEKNALVKEALNKNEMDIIRKEIEATKAKIQESAIKTISTLANSFSGKKIKLNIEFNDVELVNADKLEMEMIEDKSHSDKISNVIDVEQITKK